MEPVTACGIVRYADNHGRAGKLLGVITFIDGRSLKVWDNDMHAKCQAFAKFPLGEVRYTFKHSPKWGDSLASISRDQDDAQLYDAARLADEGQGRSHKQGGFVAQQIKKRVQTHVDAGRLR